jgi:hypothetical protein
VLEIQYFHVEAQRPRQVTRLDHGHDFHNKTLAS